MATTEELSSMMDAGKSMDELSAAGASADDIITAMRYRNEQQNRLAQAKLQYPTAQPDVDWEARKAWLLDGQAIHGELKDFYFPALAALQLGDQVEYGRQRDLLFKALRTMLGDPPPAVVVDAPASQAAPIVPK